MRCANQHFRPKLRAVLKVEAHVAVLDVEDDTSITQLVTIGCFGGMPEDNDLVTAPKVFLAVLVFTG